MRKKALRKDLIREIGQNKGRFFSMFSIVLLGVAFFSGIRVAETDMRLTGDDYFDTHNLMDVQIISDGGLTQGDIKALEELAHVKEVQGAYMVDDVAEAGGEQSTLRFLSMGETLNRPELVEGCFPNEDGECVVDSRYMESAGLSVGDTILLGENGKASLSCETLTITGTVTSPLYLALDRGNTTVGNGELDGFVLVNEEAFSLEYYTHVYLTAVEAKEEIAYTKDYEKAVEALQKDIEAIQEERCAIRTEELMTFGLSTEVTWQITDRSSLSEYDSYGENAQRMKALARVFPILFFFVAALISLTAMTRMVEEQRMQIGTLKALGYNNVQIAQKYVLYAFFATMSGGILGVLIGEKLFPYVVIVSYQIMYRSINTTVLPYHFAYGGISIGIALACTLGATIVACGRAVASMPAVLMRPLAPKHGKRVLLERIPFLWKCLSFSWKSMVRNLMRYKKRLLMTVFGVGGCMGLMLVGFGLRDSISGIAELQYGELTSYDMSIYVGEENEVDGYTLSEKLAQSEGLGGSLRISQQTCTVVNGEEDWEITLCIPEEIETLQGMYVFRDRSTQEEYILEENGIILTEKAAAELGVKAGENVSLKQNGQEETVLIQAVCENYVEHYGYMSPVLYEKLYGEAPDYHLILVEQGSLSDEKLRALGDELLTREDVLSVFYVTSVYEQINETLKSLDLVILVLVASAGLLAFVVLYNLNNISINERRRELATLKVLGFSDKEVAMTVYRENIVLTLLGIGLGALLGNYLHQFVLQTVEMDNMMFGREIAPASYGYGILATVLFACFVNWVVYFKLKGIDMVESLKSVE